MPKIIHTYDNKNDFRKKNGTVTKQKPIALMKADIRSVRVARRPVAESTFTLASWKFKVARIQKKEDAIYGKRNLNPRALARPNMPKYTKNTVAAKIKPTMSSNLKFDIIKNLTLEFSCRAEYALTTEMNC